METKDPSFGSLHEFFLNSAHQIHSLDYPFLFEKIKGNYESISYGETLKNIEYWTAYLYQSGIRKGDKVAIIFENCPEYVYFDQALQKLGAINVSIFPTLTADETQFILNDSESKAVLLGTPFLLKKFQKVEQNCPNIKQVFLAFNYQEKSEKIKLVSDVKSEGAVLWPTLKSVIEAILSTIQKNDLSALIYTSGTTGVPKGAMLSHYNFMSNCYDALELCSSINKEDRFLSFLPLSHVYERMAGYYLPTYIGAQIAYTESIEKIAQNFQEINPTIMTCVPRLLERLESKIRNSAIEKGGISAKIFFWSLKVGETYRYKLEDKKYINPILSLEHWIAEKLVFSKIKLKLGGRLKLLVSGGGALPQHVGEFFGNIGIRCQQGYGLTETSPFVSVNEFERQVHGTSGRVAPRQQVAIQNVETKEIITIQSYTSFQPDFESKEGEILCKGPNIMLGYYNNPKETGIVIDAEGWFHSGDIGKFEKGYLKITDRLKNMLKTSLGKNIYPTPIENTYLQSEKIDQIFIIGDKREYLSAIIVPKEDQLKKIFGLNDSFFITEEHMIEDEKIKSWIEQDIKKLSLQMANYCRIKDFVVKRKPFSIEEGEITVTLKQKRKVIETKYHQWIEGLY
ncbi:MAG: long-chain fatty acid--CoA ligase [Bacteroidetes bacterium]|nr:long-chain fatty acid--CoA ligase [Bacteroidota bacterium]